MEYEFNDDLGCETLTNEYKLFVLNPILIDPEISEELLRTCRWVFNDSVRDTLRNYLRIYLPKYIASYSHPLTKVPRGNLYIGVDDDGLIYGIPFMGPPPIELIQSEIDNIFQNFIRIKSIEGEYSLEQITKLLSKYKQKVTYQFIRVNNIYYDSVEKPSGYTHIYNKVYLDYIQKQEKIRRDRELYLQKKRKWEQLIYRYTNKLHNMINQFDTRSEIINFMKEKSGYLKKNFNTKYSKIDYLCETRNYYTLITELRSNYQYSSFKMEDSPQLVDNPTNVFYWVTRWKDSSTSVLKFIKPRPTGKSLNRNYSAFLLSQVHKMIPYWCEANPELKLYMLKINIPGNIDPDFIIEYKDTNLTFNNCTSPTQLSRMSLESENWTEMYRLVDNGEPQSRHL